MKKSLLLSLMTPLSFALPGQSAIASENNRPNVILIYADDIGYGDLGCYGASNVKTPNVNRLENNGVKFMNAHATAATSTPSRYSLLTGKYAWRVPGTDVAAGNAGMIIRPENYTLADMFKSCGYATAAIGKWHLGLGDKTAQQDWNAPLSAALADLGFDYSYIMAATADRVPCVFIENGQVANYDPSAPIYVSYKDSFPGEPLGRNNPELLYNLKHSHGHDMAIVNGIGRIGYMKGGGKALWKDENIADSIVTHALEFMETKKKEPFFLYLATNDIHVPRFPHERFRGKNKMGLRGDAIAQFDWTVGQVLDFLEEHNLVDNTLIILSSDNGPVVDDGYDDRAEALLNGHKPSGPLRGGKYSAFEGGTRIPLLVSWPGKTPAATVSTALVSQIDLFRSLGSLIGATLPVTAAPDSRVFTNTWLGLSAEDCPFVIEQAANHTLTIRTKEWKYIEPKKGPKMITWGPKIETGNNEKPQLYHKDDVAESNNLYDQNPEVGNQLNLLLNDIRKK